MVRNHMTLTEPKLLSLKPFLQRFKEEILKGEVPLLPTSQRKLMITELGES